MAKLIYTLFICILWVNSLYAKDHLFRYRVYLTDKVATEFSLSHPEAFLSEKALERRQRQGIKIDSTDLPVPRLYIEKLAAEGVKIIGTSRWNNTVLVETGDVLHIDRVNNLPFVEKSIKVWTSSDSIPPRNLNRKNMVKSETKNYEQFYGAAQEQVEMIQIDKLHQAGFRGEGLVVAVIDGGFLNADTIPLLKNVKIEGTYNFVHPGWDVYAELDHGMSVLSCMAANCPEVLVGTAPGASYWLLCSEDPDCECLAEEDYWAQAVEFADSVGVDIINTSLGYYAFDDESTNYHYRDLNGRVSLMSLTASKAVDKGMIVVCSAGNSGNKQWKKITPPADAVEVLTVGAVDSKRKNTVFSSVGNTADGRVKPDVMARGGSAAVVRSNGQIGWVNGTSFSSPIICGAVACLWQACPQLTAKEIIDWIRKSGDRYTYPDNIYGYGIPDFWKAYLEISNQ